MAPSTPWMINVEPERDDDRVQRCRGTGEAHDARLHEHPENGPGHQGGDQPSQKLPVCWITVTAM